MAGAQPSLPAAAAGSRLLDWYAPRARAYAWRRGRPSAYRTLVSELMLQQTQASRVVPIFRSFVGRSRPCGRSPAASRADVLRAWAGLGYNRRAVSLHRAAQAVVAEHGGRVPDDPADAARLPGVGPYTAAAVASIAGRRAGRRDRRERRVGSSRGSRSGGTPRACRPATSTRPRRGGSTRRPRRVEPGADGPRQGALPGGPAVRRVPARTVPCRFVRAGRDVGAGRPEAVPVRRIDASGPRRGGRRVARAPVGRCRGLARSTGFAAERITRRSAGWSATGWFGAPGARIGSRTDAASVYGVR